MAWHIEVPYGIVDRINGFSHNFVIFRIQVTTANYKPIKKFLISFKIMNKGLDLTDYLHL